MRTSFQKRTYNWCCACFGINAADDKHERAFRFVEEALELGQAAGLSVTDANRLVDYVYGRPSGVLAQEVGGVMNTLSLLCEANQINMEIAAEDELTRCWIKIEAIRTKRDGKPL